MTMAVRFNAAASIWTECSKLQNIIDAYYPERVARVYVLHAPTIFWSAWKMMVPFLDPVTKAKIMFVKVGAIEETLLRDISKEDISTTYGGLKQVVPIEDVQPVNWPMFKPIT